ncbi:MAG: trypsin-like peptidase domain-containing protein [Lachnospiraceae bacterium]|nr:trypsin-like peptidase domain-containing protein [Lachnospiraceae bacterium]
MKTFSKILLLGLLCGVLAAGGLFAYRYFIDDRQEKRESAATPTEAVMPLPGTATTTGKADEGKEDVPTTRTDVSQVSKNIMPAIVTIQVKGYQSYYDFFGRQFKEETAGSATGIIVAQNGTELLVATNYHVIDGAETVEVTFADGTTAGAEVKASEQADDLAVITVNAKNLSNDTLSSIRLATLGNSDDLTVGEMVIAIGNALGYGQSVTVGHVSALNREIELSEGEAMTLIQVDAAINPGNSGGALVNARGEVVGINNAKIASDKVEGVGFAIPISTAIPIIEELMNRQILKESERAYLGIVGQTISSESASAYNMPRGIYVKEVKEGSPAEAAGLKAGHVITKINGRRVMSQEEFEKVLSYTRGNTEGTVTVMVLEKGSYVEYTYNINFGSQGER